MAHIPSQIGKYELVRRLGQGGMGSVYLARDPDLDRFVAIKVLREQLFDEELLQRFFREARASANLRHDNIITIYDIGHHDHQPYMALEYVDGQTLLEIIRARPPLPLAEKLSYVEQICAGLAFAHGAGIVHRDIKPANVMVDTRGVVRILDFGIARIEGSGMTGDGAMIGTLNYMSPEQMLGRPVDFRSDIFAVGTLAYELVTYNKAFPGSLDDGLLQKLPYENPPSLSTYCEGLPEALEPIVFRALAKDPADRFAGLEQMRVALRDLRRDLDPELALETIVVTARRGDRARPSSASGRSEHPEFAERRARQIAVHLEAARAALERQDVDGAAAACEDALTLAPDNPDALALLERTERARQLRDEQSRARRERDRGVRQRVADADLRLSRGDVIGAIGALEGALALDPANAAGLALLSRLREAADEAGVPVPASLPVPEPAAFEAGGSDGRAASAEGAALAGGGPAPTVFVPRRSTNESPAGTTASPQSRIALVAAAAAVVAITGAGAWLMLRDGNPGPVVDTRAVQQPPPVPAAPAEASNAPAERANPGATVPPVAPADAPPRPEPAAPAAAPSVDPDALLRRQLEAVTTTYRRGDISAALNGIEPLLDTSDDRQVRDLAQTLAQAAARAMMAAATAADVARASERAPQSYAAAAQARTRAEDALKRNRYVDAGRVALAAADGYRRAEHEAGLAAAAASSLPPARSERETPAAASPPPIDTSAVSGAGATSSAPNPPSITEASPPPAASTAPTVPGGAGLLEAERSGIRRALALFQTAHTEKSVKLLKSIFPAVPGETAESFEDMFKDCRTYTVDFANMRISLLDEPTLATVRVRSTYTCQPKNGQRAQVATLEDLFDLEKVEGAWLIIRMGAMDGSRVR